MVAASNVTDPCRNAVRKDDSTGSPKLASTLSGVMRAGTSVTVASSLGRLACTCHDVELTMSHARQHENVPPSVSRVKQYL